MADDRSNTLGTLNDLLFQELERLNGADLEDEDAITETVADADTLADHERRIAAMERKLNHKGGAE